MMAGGADNAQTRQVDMRLLRDAPALKVELATKFWICRMRSSHLRVDLSLVFENPECEALL